MEDTYSDLAKNICAVATQNLPKRTLVGVAGPPGCGKSTIAESVVRLINEASRVSEDNATQITAKAVGLDGFHYTRRKLDSFSNRTEAHLRRGAPWTFDIDAITCFVQTLHDSAQLPAETRQTVYAPSFDHSIKDPVENDIKIDPSTAVVILDSNYLLLDEPKWQDLSNYFDLKVLVDVETAIARERVAKRHVSSGIEATVELGQKRFDSNDGLNGELIRNSCMPYDLIVNSVSVT